jgi:very-short-patch-repair endonuclease
MKNSSRRFRGTTPELEQAARDLRNQLTPAESKLWEALQHRQLAGLKFRCQHPVGQFILDFYCSAKKLVVEVDGTIHEQQKEYDLARTAQLNEFGYQVLRFTNAEVMNNLPDVLDRIRQAVEV